MALFDRNVTRAPRRVERLVESRSAVLELSQSDAAALTAVGRKLVSQERWWREPEAVDPAPPTIIECLPFGRDQWSVRVRNAVGIIRVNDLQVIVEPKIPLAHLLYLFQRSGGLPRLDITPAALSSAATLWELVAAWYLDALEGLLRSGLSSGYRVTKDQLLTARGLIVPVETTRLVMRGRPVMYCEYEELDVDIALNRVLRAAAVAIAGNVALPWTFRQRAARAIQHMEGVGQLRPVDILDALPERHTSRYVVPLQLARHVLAGTGRAIDTGEEHGFAFLIRTPEMVEKALRKIVVEALTDDVGVVKETRFLSGSHHSLTPDLVFGTGAVGDVKYKLWSGDWDRPDLYQLVAFATGFGVTHGLRVGFTTAPHGPCLVNVGSVRLAACDWVCDESMGPGEAEAALVAGLSAWWSSCCGVVAASSGL